MLCAEVVGRVRRAARFLFLFLALGSAPVSSGVTAANVILAWNASTDPMVVGYHLYYGLASGAYTNMVDTGSGTSITISNLVPATTYQFAATTYTLAGLESAYSIAVTYAVPAQTVSYLGAGLGATSVQVGQGAKLPVYLTCSDGITNAAFSVGWPGNYFLTPSLSNVAAGVASSSLQNRGTNLLISFRTAPGNPLQGSNLIAQLTFQTVSNQPSAFVNLPVVTIAGTKPNGAGYTNFFPYAGHVVVVNDVPLLQASSSGTSSLALTVFGKVGARYQLQSSSNLVAPVNWSPLNTFTQTTIAKTLIINPTSPALMYRVQQR